MLRRFGQPSRAPVGTLPQPIGAKRTDLQCPAVHKPCQLPSAVPDFADRHPQVRHRIDIRARPATDKAQPSRMAALQRHAGAASRIDSIKRSIARPTWRVFRTSDPFQRSMDCNSRRLTSFCKRAELLARDQKIAGLETHHTPARPGKHTNRASCGPLPCDDATRGQGTGGDAHRRHRSQQTFRARTRSYAVSLLVGSSIQLTFLSRSIIAQFLAGCTQGGTAKNRAAHAAATRTSPTAHPPRPRGQAASGTFLPDHRRCGPGQHDVIPSACAQSAISRYRARRA